MVTLRWGASLERERTRLTHMLNIYALENRVEALMASAHVPGLALAIVHACEVIYARGFGVTSVESGSRVTPHTLFRIGSVTKSLTGTAAMCLVDRGQLSLDEPVATYIEEFGTESQELTQTTIRMLLNHTTGLPSGGIDHGTSHARALEMHARHVVPSYPVMFPPGRFWFYSNLGIDVLGFIIAKVGNNSFADVMQETVFGPLEMRLTTFDPRVAMTYPLALSHDLDEQQHLTVRHRFADNAAEHPDGFAVSTVLDLANFALMHLQQGRFGNTHVLKPETVAQMHAPQVDLHLRDGTCYGLTFFTGMYKGVRRVWHDGAMDRFASRLLLIPQSGSAVIVVCNRGLDFWNAMNQVVNLVCDRLLDLDEQAVPELVGAAPAAVVSPTCVGHFRGFTRGVASLATDHDHLTLVWKDKTVALTAVRDDLFVGDGDDAAISVGIVRESDQSVRFIVLNGEPCERIDTDDLSEPDAAVWPSYAGVYVSTTGDTPEQLEVQPRLGCLSIRSSVRDAAFPCIPWTRRTFRSRLGLVTFDVDADGVARFMRVGGSGNFQRLIPPA